MSELFRLLPSVDLILQRVTEQERCAHLPRPLLKDLVNLFLDQLRADIRSGRIAAAENLQWFVLESSLSAFLQQASRPHFRRVLNATGVVVHTNLGRSLLANQAVIAVQEACRHYSNLEFSLDTGQRGSRYSHVEELLCRLTGAEAALVVNNNAAAVLLMLHTLAKGREVVVAPRPESSLAARPSVDPIKKNSMNRALRIDKMTLAALEATLRLVSRSGTGPTGNPDLAHDHRLGPGTQTQGGPTGKNSTSRPWIGC